MKRIACIDLGTNAIRFIIYEFDSLTEYQVLYKHRAIVRLGQGVFSKGQLSPEILGKIPAILLDYQKKAREMQVNKICCAATSAVREASNGEAFLKEVEKQTGLKFKSLTGAQEARILALALQWNRPAPQNLIYGGVDIGGGSTEVFWYHDDGYIDGISMPVGTVRVLELFCDYPLNEKQVGKIRSYVKANLQEFQNKLGSLIPHRAFGVSGLIHCVFDLMNKDHDEPILYHELEVFISNNQGLTPPELQDKFGIEKNRSEILLPGCIILAQLMALGGFHQIYRAEVGLRDGMAIEEMISQGERFKSLNQERLRESVIDWAYGLLDKYVGDISHAQFVEDVCMHIIEKLTQIEKVSIDETDELYLRVAAILNSIGQFVNHTRHLEHSRYIITQSQSPFLSDRETQFVALLAYYHQSKSELPTQKEFETLGYEASEYQKFLVCLGVLRIALSLDHQHRQLLIYRDIRQTPDGFEVLVEASDKDQVSEEIRVFESAAKLLSKVLGKPIRLKVTHVSLLH